MTANRFYSAESGRWLNRDPIEELGGNNLYGYVENNPIKYSDPSGLDTKKDKDPSRMNCWEIGYGILDASLNIMNRIADAHRNNLHFINYDQGHIDQFIGHQDKLKRLVCEWEKRCNGKGGPPSGMSRKIIDHLMSAPVPVPNNNPTRNPDASPYPPPWERMMLPFLLRTIPLLAV